MSVIDTIRDLFAGDGEPLLPEDKPLWAAAQSIGGLAALTARWLAGDIKSQPGYYGEVDVDEGVAPGLTDALVALNRAEFLTHDSQAGFDGLGFDGAHWTQLAAVSGLCDPGIAVWLRKALTGTRFQMVENRPAAWPTIKHHRRRGIDVTHREGAACTRFGSPLDLADLEDMYDGVDKVAFEDVCHAWQVTVYDPQVGSNVLWSVLHAAARAQIGATQ